MSTTRRSDVTTIASYPPLVTSHASPSAPSTIRAVAYRVCDAEIGSDDRRRHELRRSRAVAGIENVFTSFVPSRRRARKVPQAENHRDLLGFPWVPDTDPPEAFGTGWFRSPAHNHVTPGSNREVARSGLDESTRPFLDRPSLDVPRRVDRGLTRLQHVESSSDLDVEGTVGLALELRARGEDGTYLGLRRACLQLTPRDAGDLGLGPPRAEQVVDALEPLEQPVHDLGRDRIAHVHTDDGSPLRLGPVHEGLRCRRDPARTAATGRSSRS